jgi:Skp family chaperone for outer membrane proteins
MFVMAALVLGIGTLAISTSTQAQDKSQEKPARSKIAVFNIAKVLRQYNKANQDGKEIAKKRQTYLDQINGYRNQIAEKNKQMAATVDVKAKESIQEQIYALNQEIDKLDRNASKVLTEMSNDTIVRVHKEISGLVKDIADANGFEMILAYPDASDDKEKNTPLVAQLMLQTPALMPFYVSKSLDITDYVVENLNKRYPAPPVDPKELQPVGGTGSPMGGTGSPMGGTGNPALKKQ